MQPERRIHLSFLAINLGLLANMFLAAIKTGTGILGHSPALLADGIMSVSDVAYYVMVSIFVRLAHKPADDEHPYGHSQLETIASLVVGAFIITTGVAIFWDSINKVYDLWAGEGAFQGASESALWVALFTVSLKVTLTIFTRLLGRRTQSAVVQALAFDHRNDVFTASAATLGIFFGRQGYPWVDPLAGALVALVILYTGVEIIRDSASDLMDTIPGKTLDQQISALLNEIAGITQVEEIKVHRFGPYLVSNITIGVDGDLSVKEGDSIATQAEHSLLQNIDFMRRVHVHYHPARHPPIHIHPHPG